jgi:hypothetical protein
MMPSTDMMAAAQTSSAAAAMAPACQFPSASCAPPSHEARAVDPVSHLLYTYKAARSQEGRREGERNAR